MVEAEASKAITKDIEGRHPNNNQFVMPQLPAFPQAVHAGTVGGRLSLYLENWKMVTQDQWVLSVIEKGYVIDFWSKPPLSSIPIPSPLPADKVKRQAVRGQVNILLEKRVIEPVLDPTSPGFYNRLFVVPKPAKNTWRAILDLSALGRLYVTREGFKMETADVVRKMIVQGEWAASLDFSDAYFHVMMHPSSRKYLRFALDGQVFQFRALPMGLSSSARVFTRIIKVIKAWVQRYGIQLHQYIDDWLIHCHSRKFTRVYTQHVKMIAERLGFLINEKKSELTPMQQFNYLGLCFNLVEGKVSITMERWQKLQEAIKAFQTSTWVTARVWQSLIGRMVSTERVVHLGMLHIRPFQVALSRQWSQRTGSQNDKLLVPPELIRLLDWWKNPEHVCQGVSFQLSPPNIQVFVDASSSGWGGHVGMMKAQGKWSDKEKGLHINAQELLAVQKVLKSFSVELSGRTVMIASDNVTTVSYIRRQGGTRSFTLLRLTQELYRWAEAQGIRLRCRHIAGKLNVWPILCLGRGRYCPQNGPFISR